MTTCAVNVDYVHLIDRARAYIESNFRRPSAAGARAAASAHLWRGTSGWAPGAPVATSAAAAMADVDMIPPRVAPDVLAPQVFRAERAVRKRIALLAGCAQQALNGDINAATIRLLLRHGCEVVIAAGSGCCGSLNLHMGREEEARAFARQNIRAWEKVREGGLDAIIINASGCGTTVKDYGHQFTRGPSMAQPAAETAALTRDVSEFLWAIGLCKPSAGVPAYRVVYHDPCSMQHVQRVIEQPRALLRAAGFEVADVPERHFCCGSAGTYNLLQPDMAKAEASEKPPTSARPIQILWRPAISAARLSAARRRLASGRAPPRCRRLGRRWAWSSPDSSARGCFGPLRGCRPGRFREIIGPL